MTEKLRCGADKKFIVLNIDDVYKYAFAHEQRDLDFISNEIVCRKFAVTGKVPNEYLVINLDEPYANEIIEIMKKYGHWSKDEL